MGSSNIKETAPGDHPSILQKIELIQAQGYLARKQGRKRPLDTPKRMIERREKEGEREKER